MSLIQQALEKTSREQETRTANPPSGTKAYERDPMGVALEQELTRVQQSYARQRRLYWGVSLGVLAAFFLAGIAYMGIRHVVLRGKASPVKVAAPVAAHVPVRIYSGNIYRLTGITDLSGNAIAVINGRLVGAGDALDGKAVVREIGNGEVLLDVQGKEIKLVL